MKKIIITTIIAGFFLATCGQLTAQTSQLKSSPYLDEIIQAKMASAHIPGLASCIIKEGQIRWIGTYGYAYIEQDIPVDTSTLFYIASIAKTVTVTALMQLWEEELFQLDQDINDYLNFEVRIPNFPEAPITFRMLCTHTSSIKDNWGLMPWYWGEDPPPLNQFLFDYLSPDGANYNQYANFYYNVPPGTEHHYSNVGVALLGYLIELMGGTTFPYQTNERIFEPLQMNETAWFLSELDTMQMAMPYSWNGTGYTPYYHYSHAEYPSGGIRTSVDQLANFLLCYMNGGNYMGQQILNNETVDMILTPQIPQINPEIGLIWYVANYAGQIYCGHSGGNLGCKTSMYFRPEDDIGVIMLTNGESDFTDLAAQIFAYAADSIEVQCLPDGITFTTQEEIDNFPSNYPGCTEIEGDVIINGEDITNLDGLSVLTNIGGNLLIGGEEDPWEFNPNLINLNGLENLMSISGNLQASYNISLLNLVGFESLVSIGGNIEIFRNDMLVGFSGMEGLTTIVGNLSIWGNNSILNMSGFDNIETIGGDLAIGHTIGTFLYGNSMVNLVGLENLTSIGGSLGITGGSGIGSVTDSLVSLSGLENLTYIGGYLSLWYNQNLITIEALGEVTHIGGFISIEDCGSLSNLRGLEGVNTLGANLKVMKNPSLTELSSLENLTSIDGFIRIVQNETLYSLSALENLSSINGFLRVVLNDTLPSLSGIENIEPGSITDLSIWGNPNLSTCEVQSICDYLAAPNGDITIHSNATGCMNQQQVEDACESQCLPDGITFTTQEEIDNFQINYPGCTEIEGGVEICGTDITQLDSLLVLTAIGGYLNIHDNPDLITLSGLENIEAGTIDSLSITNNENLSTCHARAICDYLTSINPIVEIHDNAEGCDNPEEIIAVCYVSVDEIQTENGLAIFPNPFTNSTTLEINLTEPGRLEVKIFNQVGQQINTITKDCQNAGMQKIDLETGDLEPGVYFCVVKSGERIETVKMIKL